MQILLIECLHFFMEDNMGVTKGRIEFLWSVMGGLLFSMLPSLYLTGHYFSTQKWLDSDNWDGFGTLDYLDEFVLGFIFTFILIKSIKKYNSLK